jgi:hypothetical protein
MQSPKYRVLHTTTLFLTQPGIEGESWCVKTFQPARNGNPLWDIPEQ